MASASRAGHRDQLWQARFGVKQGSVRQGWHRPAHGGAQALQGPCPSAKVPWPQVFSLRTFSHRSFHITQLQGYSAAPHWSLNPGSPAPAREGKRLQTLLLLPGPWYFLSLEQLFWCCSHPITVGLEAFSAHYFLKGKREIQRSALSTVIGTSAIHSKRGKYQHQEQLNWRFVWVFYYSLWICAWYCFLYLSDINKTQVTALTSMEFGFDSVQLR